MQTISCFNFIFGLFGALILIEHFSLDENKREKDIKTSITEYISASKQCLVLKSVDKSGKKSGNDTYLALCNTVHVVKNHKRGWRVVISKIQHGHLHVHVPIHTILYCTILYCTLQP